MSTDREKLEALVSKWRQFAEETYSPLERSGWEACAEDLAELLSQPSDKAEARVFNEDDSESPFE